MSFIFYPVFIYHRSNGEEMMKILQNDALCQDYINEFQLQPFKDSPWVYMEYESGECICQQGTTLTHLFFLVKGKVKIYTTSPAGRRLIVAFNKPFEVFGEIELIEEVEVLNTIEAVGTVQVIAIPIHDAKKLRSEAAFKEFLLRSLARKFYTKSNVLSFHLLHETEVRLASDLISITHDEYGVFQTRFIPKSALRDIAEFIGTTVRHQNRVIQSFVQEGILTRVPGGIEIIEPQALKEKAKEHPYEMQ